jgi:hypothetical protein
MECRSFLDGPRQSTHSPAVSALVRSDCPSGEDQTQSDPPCMSSIVKSVTNETSFLNPQMTEIDADGETAQELEGPSPGAEDKTNIHSSFFATLSWRAKSFAA